MRCITHIYDEALGLWLPLSTNVYYCDGEFVYATTAMQEVKDEAGIVIGHAPLYDVAEATIERHALEGHVRYADEPAEELVAVPAIGKERGKAIRRALGYTRAEAVATDTLGRTVVHFRSLTDKEASRLAA